MKGIFCLLAIILTMDFTSTDWLEAIKQNVATNRIVQTLEELSFTSCFLQCKRNEYCVSCGMEVMDGVGACYFIRDDTLNYLSREEADTIELNVVGMRVHPFASF